MASSHGRSISLPSRSHPTIPQIQEIVSQLKPGDFTSLPLSAISCRLNGLGHLFDYFDKFLLLPQTQAALSRGCNEKWANELLDGFLLPLDVGGTAKDVLSQFKEHVQELQSILRRRRADESELVKEIGQYLGSRKKARRVIHKVLKESKTKFSCSMWDKGNETMAMVKMSTQIQEVTLTILQALLCHASGLKTQSKLSNCILVSNLMRSKQACVEDAMRSNEFEKVDGVLEILLGQKTKKFSNMKLEDVKTELVKLELRLEELEQDMEFLYRALIKARVSLLNILNH